MDVVQGVKQYITRMIKESGAGMKVLLMDKETVSEDHADWANPLLVVYGPVDSRYLCSLKNDGCSSHQALSMSINISLIPRIMSIIRTHFFLFTLSVTGFRVS